MISSSASTSSKPLSVSDVEVGAIGTTGTTALGVSVIGAGAEIGAGVEVGAVAGATTEDGAGVTTGAEVVVTESDTGGGVDTDVEVSDVTVLVSTVGVGGV
jgi:hypothetical protein